MTGRVIARARDRQRAKKRGWIALFCVWWVLFPVSVASQDPDEAYHIAVFTPTTEGNTYWPEVHRVMRAAEVPLNLDITFYEFDVGDRFAKTDEGVRILHRTPIPDAAIFSVAYGQAEALMDTAEALEISFVLHGPLFPQELEALGGGPQREYEHWIGHFQEDEEEKGYALARELLSAATTHNRTAPDGTVRVVGISGDATWYGTALREAGLRRAVMEHPRARLLQVVPTRWTQQEGREMTARVLSRYSDVTVVWGASDQLALGATDALAAVGLEPGIDAFTGGLDLSLVGLQAVLEGRLTATVAAPVSMWTESLHYVSDYLQGNDFAEQVGTEIRFQPEIATQAAVEEILRLRLSPRDR